ncbi:hypothetical protein DPMN_181803 [Dreissena polymorpha]|uniref:B box-type domain-containing protein n=1 Tax=Dreissena polymorpha TaxID=45954 RepID=A0A9D4DE87_DREPO|nr:hypothetical protein DPMN_181803 [Dreissena polymorpha]
MPKPRLIKCDDMVQKALSFFTGGKMGCGASGRGQVGPAPDEPGISGEEPILTCAQCVLDGKNKVATWWCEDCREFICNYCAWSHGNTPSTKHHYLIRADAIPKEKQKVNKPGKQSWARPAESKQAVMSTYFDARAELHYVEIENLNKWNQAEGAERVRGGMPPATV